VLTSKMKFIIK